MSAHLCVHTGSDLSSLGVRFSTIVTPTRFGFEFAISKASWSLPFRYGLHLQSRSLGFLFCFNWQGKLCNLLYVLKGKSLAPCFYKGSINSSKLREVMKSLPKPIKVSASDSYNCPLGALTRIWSVLMPCLPVACFNHLPMCFSVVFWLSFYDAVGLTWTCSCCPKYPERSRMSSFIVIIWLRRLSALCWIDAKSNSKMFHVPLL